MKNKTILKAVKIAFVLCVMLTVCIIPTFAETATTPEYNGYIPIGEYVYTNDYEHPDGSWSLGNYSAESWFYAFEGDTRIDCVLMDIYGTAVDCLTDESGETVVVITKGESIYVTRDYQCTETAYNDFFKTFSYVEPDPEPAPSTNIYQTCYDLINTYVFGGTVVANTYQDLICIAFSAAACIFLMSLPFLLVWIIIKVWF